jgi:hypothetical protein
MRGGDEFAAGVFKQFIRFKFALSALQHRHLGSTKLRRGRDMERKGLVEGQTFDTGLRMIGTAGNPCIGSLQERDVAVVMDDLLRYRRK